ncbi:hypothetical protein PO124_34105 [Bacillus licheniformis]|nr:hypothetical protein [Bacillus licheniformis]
MAMKPKDAAGGIAALRPIAKEQLLISVLAGIPIHTIQHYAGLELPVVRAMPNTSAAIQNQPQPLRQARLSRKSRCRKRLTSLRRSAALQSLRNLPLML